MRLPASEVALKVVVVTVVAAGVGLIRILGPLQRIQPKKSSKPSKPPLPQARLKPFAPAKSHGMEPERNGS